MTACRYLFLFLAGFLLSTPFAMAGTPTLDESCEDGQGKSVPTRYNNSRQYFAEAAILSSERSSAASGAQTRFVIYINPERIFLGRNTQQWLYFRQCAHITLDNRIVKRGVRGLNIKDEERADCWAARKMMEGSSRVSSRMLYSIERDMERVVQEDRWHEVLPGPQRRISLKSCSK